MSTAIAFKSDPIARSDRSAASPSPSFAAATLRRIEAAFETLALWRRRMSSRQQLARLNDRILADVGLSSVDARRESAKWFWQA